MLATLLLAVSANVAVSYEGPHNVATKATWDYHGPCGPGIVYYPESDGNFPLLSFAHGLGAGNVKIDYSYTLLNVASWGFIIVALEGCQSSNVEYEAQEAMMDWAFSHWSTIDHDHPGGIFGHSMGGGSTIAVAGDGNACQKYGLQGAFMMHPCNFQTGANAHSPAWIPSLYVSGSKDGTCSPGTTYKEYKAGSANNKPRGFGVYSGYGHATPCGGGYNLEVIDIANWFGCYLWYNQDSCSAIYNGFCGDGKKIATGQQYGCELFMNSNSFEGDDFQTMWENATASNDALQALNVPWGRHNGTWDGFMHEVKTRGNWIVQQRKAYLTSRGLYTPHNNVTNQMLVV